jgi:hypothetical protein
MKQFIDIANSDMPIAEEIRQALKNCPPEELQTVLGDQTENEFVDERVEVYLESIEEAIQSGDYNSAGCIEVATAACLEGIPKSKDDSFLNATEQDQEDYLIDTVD